MKQKISIISIIFSTILFAVILFSCSSNTDSSSKGAGKEAKTKEKQLNISIFVDLSSRIDPTINSNINPSPKDRDIAIVDNIVKIFRSDMEKRGAIKAKGKIKVIFDPLPNLSNIDNLASKMKIDLSKMEVSDKKKVYDNIENDFNTSLETVYNKIIEEQNWIGSDIYRFFKKDVLDRCILDNHRNILVVLTDGYIYHENSKKQDKNKYSYILGTLIQKWNIRGKSNWKEIIDQNGYGLIAPDVDLKDLEVLILEINPEKNHPNDDEILDYLLSNWMKEMNVGKYKVSSTNLPSVTSDILTKFFNN